MRDGHDLLSYQVLCGGCTADGGPRACRQRGQPLPERYLPGRAWMRMDERDKQKILKALQTPPADWAIQKLVMLEEDSPQVQDSVWETYARIPRGR